MDMHAVPYQYSFKDWFDEVLDSNSQQEAEFFGVCAWQIWSARNDFCFEKIQLAPNLCYKRSYDILTEYKKANSNTDGPKEKRAPVKWSPPDAGYIKLNADAAVDIKEDRVGLGVVAQDENGAVLPSASKTIWPFSDVERAEIEAFGWAIELVKERRWNKCIFEGDAQNVVKGLQSHLPHGFHNQVLIDNALYSVIDIQQHSFNFCFRQANGVASRLARWVVACIGSRVWLDGGPVWISDIVLSDSSS